MSGDFSVNIEIIHNSKRIEEIKAPVDFASGSKAYIDTLRSTHKLVNDALTKIIEAQASEEVTADDEDCDDDDSDADVKQYITAAKRKPKKQRNSKRRRT